MVWGQKDEVILNFNNWGTGLLSNELKLKINSNSVV